MEAIQQGWLVKSPPDKKFHGAWVFGKFLKAKWRRRFFVLHSPPASASIPGSYALDYYSDDTLKKRVGCIDIDQCEEVIATLDSSHYQYLFALRTKHKSKDRTYYLATDTESDMNKWVSCLCRVCGLLPDDPPPSEERRASWPQPQPQPQTQQPASPPVPVSAVQQERAVSAMPAMPPSPRYVPDPTSQEVSPVHNNNRGEEYIHLDECYSNGANKNLESRRGAGSGSSPLDRVPPAPAPSRRDSIPDEPAPPPPGKSGEHPWGSSERESSRISQGQTYDHPSKSYINILDSDDESGIYKVPPSKYPQSPQDVEGLYKVPPVRNTNFKEHPEDALYNVPKSHHHAPPTPHSTSQHEWYDVPPPARSVDRTKRDSSSSSGSRSSGSHNKHANPADSAYESDAMYDHPKYGHDGHGGSKYNPAVTSDELYDVPPPKPYNNSASLLDSVPPPPRPPKVLTTQMSAPQTSYMNLPKSGSLTHPKNEPQHPQSPPVFTQEDMYDTPPPVSNTMLAMSPPPPHCGPIIKHKYVNAPGGVAIAVGPGYTARDVESMYVPPGSPQDPRYQQQSQQLYADMSGYNRDSIYTARPSNRPVRNLVDEVVPPPRPPKLTEVLETYTIGATQRTRSFKRLHSIQKDVPPIPRRIGNEHDSSSDESSVESHDCSQDSLPHRGQTPDQPFPQLHRTPPPPKPSQASELKYLDLSLDGRNDNPQKSPSVSRTSHMTGNVSPTDYREIDFLKTEALSKTKQQVESKRKSSERSVDE